MHLNDPIAELRGVGEAVAKKLRILKIETIGDLLLYYPRRYEDYSHLTPIARAKPGIVSIQAKITSVVGRYSRRGLHVTEALASDDSGSMRLIWFNQPYRAKAIDPKKTYFIAGEFGLRRQRMSMTNPSMEVASDFPVNAARIVPVYKETKDFKSAQIRKLIKNAQGWADLIPENLPQWLGSEYDFIDHQTAIKSMHFPEDDEMLDEARKRLAFEEIFELSLAALLNKQDLLQVKALPVKFDQTLAKQFVSSLPFKLSDEQRQAVWQIYQDIEKDTPMNRLVEGDVGTGKTVVATMAAVMAIKQGYQVAFMAPTELLAKQHAETIFKLLEPLGMEKELTILIGSQSASQKKMAVENLAAGKVSLIIGTHSLIQERVDLKKLGLVIIDEQHRFGVKQRQALQAKAGHMPHVLSMTATPIPRSLQLTLYGELDISLIKQKPVTSSKITTQICTKSQRPALYKNIANKIKSGGQVFVVCPSISPGALPTRSAEEVYEDLSKGIYKEFNVALIHSKLKAEEKEKIIADFSAKKIDVLVATTIIEVGIHIPNASVMVIEGASRFGLAQIHQLRGRVGRGSDEGFCYLLLDDDGPPSTRLRALETTQDGFALAELDLKIRGPGAIYGTLQHGPIDLRLVQFTDQKLIMLARKAAQEFINREENLLQYHQLSERMTDLRSIANLN